MKTDVKKSRFLDDMLELLEAVNMLRFTDIEGRYTIN